jgi:Holliday junction resolvasome RuvABC endonuclease subunit
MIPGINHELVLNCPPGVMMHFITYRGIGQFRFSLLVVPKAVVGIGNAFRE